MKKRTDRIIVLALLGLAVVCSAVYFMERSRAIARIRVEVGNLQRQSLSQSPAFITPERLLRMFPGQPGISLFVDGLYQHAQKAGIRNLEVQTLAPKDKGPRAGGRKEEKTKVLQAFPLRIMMDGTYRNIAEYMRLMQNDDRFIRILELELQPGKDLHRAIMTLEIFSIEGQDAS